MKTAEEICGPLKAECAGVLRLREMYAEQSPLPMWASVRKKDGQLAVRVPTDINKACLEVLINHGADMYSAGFIHGTEDAKERIRRSLGL